MTLYNVFKNICIPRCFIHILCFLLLHHQNIHAVSLVSEQATHLGPKGSDMHCKLALLRTEGFDQFNGLGPDALLIPRRFLPEENRCLRQSYGKNSESLHNL